jgi:uridine kinase
MDQISQLAQSSAAGSTYQYVHRLLIEGVGATRKQFDAYRCYRIWVDAPPTVRLQRGLVRDGEAMKGMWEHWMAAEEEHFRKDQPRGRADVIVSGVS